MINLILSNVFSFSFPRYLISVNKKLFSQLEISLISGYYIKTILKIFLKDTILNITHS